MKRIMIDKELCQGCLNCTISCMMVQQGKSKLTEVDLSNRELANNNYIALDKCGKPTPIFCRHCDEADCVETCSSGAMTKDPETGIVSCDKEQCASCLMCVIACPYGVLKVENEKRIDILKCGLCVNESQPACVAHCPSKAIYVEEKEASA